MEIGQVGFDADEGEQAVPESVAPGGKPDAVDSGLVANTLETLPFPCLLKNEDLVYVYANRSAQKVIGKSESEIVGHRAADLFPPDDAHRFEDIALNVLETGERVDIQQKLVNPQSRQAMIRVRFDRIENADGERFIREIVTDVTEIDSRHTARLRRAEVIEAAVAHMAQGLIVLDGGIVEYCSTRASELLEIPEDAAAPSVNWLELLQFSARRGDCGEGERGEHKARAHSRAFSEARIAHFRFRRITPTGRSVVFDCRKLEEGERYIVTLSDVTEERSKEAGLKAALKENEVFRSIVDHMPMSIYAKTSDLRLIYVNNAWVDLVGVPAGEAIGKTDAEIMGVEGLQFAEDDLKVLQSEETCTFNETVERPDGTVSHRIARKRRLDAADGTRYLIGSTTDISEIREKEQRLHDALAQAELFREILDNLPVAVYAKNDDLTVAYVNPAWSGLMGVAVENAVGQTDIDMFGEMGREFAAVDNDLRGTGKTVEVSETVELPDGSKRYQRAHKRWYASSDGSSYLLGSTVDETELKRVELALVEARNEAQAADRAKSEFLANMSHEIRTPMNGVMGMAELLAKTTLDNKQRTFVDIIVKSGASLLTIINDILDFSKIDAGQMELDPKPFRLAEAIEDVATLVSSRVAEKDLELAVRIDPDMPEMLVGDVGRIRQIVTNLLGNAVKFTEHGHVKVDVSLVDPSMEAQAGKDLRLRFSVEDTGIGIPADKLDRIFDKFSQVDTSATRRHEGTGLGLAIASSLVGLMGGRMQVTSEVGKGSTFSFEIDLPVHEANQRRRSAPMDVTGARILVVDDNAVNRAILMEQMAAWRFDAATCTSGAEALALVEAADAMGLHIDLAILDYHMPEMNGAELAARLMKLPAAKGLPIIMLTSVDMTEDGRTFSSLGVQAHLTKPARSSLLLETMVEVLQESKAAPRRPSEPLAEQVHEAPVAVAEPSRVDILVAEDNEVNQLVFSEILEMTGYSFAIAPHGAAAVEMFGRLRPRLVLMDVSMPGMNGLEATAAIRRMEAGSGTRTPIVGVTAHAVKGDVERCREAGMDDYLAKPISPGRLSETVAVWLESDEIVAERFMAS